MKNNKHFFNPNLLDISLIINTIQTIGCISYTKGTILKANHNAYIETEYVFSLYFIYQRYDFESKSQLILLYVVPDSCCISYTKGTILKANHNYISIFSGIFSLYFIYQRYDFESKSQHSGANGRTSGRCISYTKGTILKANHNT